MIACNPRGADNEPVLSRTRVLRGQDASLSRKYVLGVVLVVVWLLCAWAVVAKARPRAEL